MNRFLVRGLPALTVMWMSASAALAEVEPQDMVSGRQSRKFALQGQAKVEVDSNVARVSRQLAAIQLIKPKDTIYSPSAQVDAVLPVGRQLVYLNGTARYVFHDANKRLDRTEVDLTSGVGNSIGRCGSVVGGGYKRGLSELTTRSFSETVENILSVRRASAALTCMTPSGLGFVANVSRDWAKNSIAQTQDSDFTNSTANFGVTIGRPNVGTATVFGGYSENIYDSRVSTTGGRDGYDVISAGVTLERRLGARINAKASVIYSDLTLKAPLLQPPGAPTDIGTNFKQLNYNAEVTYRPSSRIQAALNFDRNITPTIISGRAYEIQTKYSSRIEYRLGSRVTTRLTLNQAKVNTRGGTPINAQVLTDSRVRAGQLAVEYRQNDKLSLELSGGIEKRTANNVDFNYTSERVALALIAKY